MTAVWTRAGSHVIQLANTGRSTDFKEGAEEEAEEDNGEEEEQEQEEEDALAEEAAGEDVQGRAVRAPADAEESEDEEEVTKLIKAAACSAPTTGSNSEVG